MLELDFDIVIILSLKEARVLRKYLWRKFGIHIFFSRGYYKISFDLLNIKKVSIFWDKNSFYRTHIVNMYKVKDFISICDSSENPFLLRKTKQQERQSHYDLFKAK